MVKSASQDDIFDFPDPILGALKKQMRSLRGLPRIVFALVNFGPEKDQEIVEAVNRLPEAYIGCRGRKLLGASVSFFLLGFHPKTDVTVESLMLSLSGIPFDEVLVFVDGKPTLQMSRMSPVAARELPDAH